METISSIKNKMKSLSFDEQCLYIETLKLDSRKGVKNIIDSTLKTHEKIKLEKKRLETLTLFEQDLIAQGYKRIVGIDEVGRGPLAGPVVTAAVMLKELDIYEGINDSKKVPLKHRERLFEELQETAVEIAFGMASPEEIDELNILNATKLAMKRAIENLSEKPDHLLIDAVRLDDIDIDQTNLIKGDEKSVSIAAASIMAKVTRDRIMEGYDKKYPGYDFASNKGYGTSRHYDGLNSLGYTEIHRKSFIKDFI